MSWSAAQYRLFEAERNRPIEDLLARLPAGGVRRAADIGCGPGNSTQLLQQRYPQASLIGIDSSPDMIAAARRRLPAAQFELVPIEHWSEPGPFDLILANAVLQWLGNHVQLLPTLLAKLDSGGALAVQMPDNLEEPAHRLMRELAADGPWAATLAQAAAARAERHEAAWYFEQLRGQSTRVEIWRTTYFHPLPSTTAIVEWFKGSALRPYLNPLSAPEREAFLQRYRHELASAYPPLPDGSVLLPFPRLFFIASR